jgi:hypothetical protein
MSSLPRFAVHVATDDSTAVLFELLRGLEAQTQAPEAVVVIDNALSGRKRPSEPLGLPLTWLRNPRPQGFGRSQNQAIALAASRANGMDARQTIILVTQEDVWPSPELLIDLARAFYETDSLVLAGPKMLQAHVISALDGERRELELSDALLSNGMNLSLFGAVKRETGEEKGEWPDPNCFAIRLSTLVGMSIHGPWFDEDAAPEATILKLFKRLKQAGKVEVVSEARAWRLVARSEIG